MMICSEVVIEQQEVPAEAAGTATTLAYIRRKEPTLWNDAMTRLLISARLEMDKQFNQPIPKKNLWTKIAQTIVDEGYTVTPDDCDVKWRNLLNTFRKNQVKAKKCGEGVIVWPYYSLINEGLPHKISRRPPPYNIRASLLAETYQDCVTSSSSVLGDFGTRSSKSVQTLFSPPLASSSRLRGGCKILSGQAKRFKPAGSEEEPTPTLLPPRWISKLVEAMADENRARDALEERRWKALAEREERRLQLEEKKLQAMCALVDALKK